MYGNGFNFLLTILSQLFYIPIMLLSWGVTQTGYWIFFIAIPSMLSFWKLDFSEASRQELTLNKKKNPNVIYSISLIFTLLTVVIFGIVYFFINLNFLENFEVIKNHNITNLNIILILILVTIFVLGVSIITFLSEISEYLKIISKDERELKVKPTKYMQKALWWSFYLLLAIVFIFVILNFFF